MGEMADYLLESHGFSSEESEYPYAEDYLHLSDEELRAETALCRSKKLKSIRAFPYPLTPKQRYCLAAWLAEQDSKYI